MSDSGTKLHGSRGGEITKAVKRSMAELGTDFGPVQQIDRAIAERTAQVVDAAYRADDARLALAALRDLRSVVARLDPGADDDDDDRDPEDGGPDALADALGAGPEVGDAEDS